MVTRLQAKVASICCLLASNKLASAQISENLDTLISADVAAISYAAVKGHLGIELDEEGLRAIHATAKDEMFEPWYLEEAYGDVHEGEETED